MRKFGISIFDESIDDLLNVLISRYTVDNIFIIYKNKPTDSVIFSKILSKIRSKNIYKIKSFKEKRSICLKNRIDYMIDNDKRVIKSLISKTTNTKFPSIDKNNDLIFKRTIPIWYYPKEYISTEPKDPLKHWKIMHLKSWNYLISLIKTGLI